MPRAQRGDAEIIREAKAQFERCVAWESTARMRAKADRKFACGDAWNMWQWDGPVLKDRVGRPCLTHNKIRQHNLQIINDARQNKVQIKVTPTGGEATYEAAQIFSGIIRRIEYESKAVDAYSTATYHQVESGIGYVTVDARYPDDKSFEQDLFIERVPDPDKIYLDPDCQMYDKSDAKFAFVYEDIPQAEWEKEHGPNAALPATALDNTADAWIQKGHVRRAIYWRRNVDSDTLHLLRSGATVRESELDDAQMDMLRPMIERSRDLETHSVEWFKIEADRIIERGDWAGKYIPIVPFIGEETVIDGQLDRKGHTRSQLDAQRIYNYWASSAVEQVALQTKVPFIAPAKAIEGHEKYWYSANVQNHAVLPFNPTDDNGQPLPAPERAPPPEMAQAYIQGMMIARQDLLDVTGQYQAELGMPSNERSGVAIQQRQRQGDTATYHYIDNQAKAIRQVGRILIDLIPKIYDTTRVTKIMAEDGTDSSIISTPNSRQAHMQIAMQPGGMPQTDPQGNPLQLTQQQADQQREDENTPDPRIIFNPNVGRYDVEADVGPSFGTQRQEAANAFTQIMAQNPAAFAVVGDLWAENSDFPGAEELAERLRRGLPQQYKPGPDPQMLQMQQQMQQQQQMAQGLLRQADAKVATLQGEVVRQKEKADEKAQQIEVDAYEAETNRLKAIGAVDPMLVQMIARQLWENMMQTDIVPHIKNHAQLEQALQPVPPASTNGSNASGQSAGATA